MAKKVALTGANIIAEAMRQVSPDTVCAYPITPQTGIVQRFSKFVADGKVDTEFVTVESEHSAMSGTVGASASGARAMTATAANGLALMWEVVYIASSTRLPIVMPVVNRALSGPINIHCDYSDMMGARDSSWIQLYSENAQEAYDNTIQAIKICENKDIRLPAMINLDGFIISHAVEDTELLADEEVKDFVGEYSPEHTLLDPDEPITVGPVDLGDFYFEFKMQQAEAMTYVKDVLKEVAQDYKKISGREYGLFEEYKINDADLIVITMGSTAGTAKKAVDQMRKKGIKAGLLKIRLYRPFPAREIVKVLEDARVVAVMDRAESFANTGGPLYTDVRAAFYDQKAEVEVINYIYGLGGRDITVKDIETVIDDLNEIDDRGEVEKRVNYLGARE